MSTQAERIVRIEHPKTGKRYAVSVADYKNAQIPGLGEDGAPGTYQDAGYEIMSYEDGTPYEEGAEPTPFAISKVARMPEIGAVEEPAPKAQRARAAGAATATATKEAE